MMMHLPWLRLKNSKLLCFTITLTASLGSMQAVNLLTATSPAALTCSTTTGPGTTATVVVKPVTALIGSSTIAVTFGSVTGGLTVTAPGTTALSVSNQAAGLTYSVKSLCWLRRVP